MGRMSWNIATWWWLTGWIVDVDWCWLEVDVGSEFSFKYSWFGWIGCSRRQHNPNIKSSWYQSLLTLRFLDSTVSFLLPEHFSKNMAFLKWEADNPNPLAYQSYPQGGEICIIAGVAPSWSAWSIKYKRTASLNPSSWFTPSILDGKMRPQIEGWKGMRMGCMCVHL